MCRHCLVSVAPDRGTTANEGGAYLVNFKGCHGCKGYAMLKVADRVHNGEEGDNGQEVITFNHVCPTCGHMVAEHQYTFEIVGGYQEYTMNCDLCGVGEDTASILPDDPRKANRLY